MGQDHPTLMGTVSDQASAPLAKVSATLYSLDRVLQTKSRADGQFRLPSVPSGTYDLEISAESFIKQKLALSISNRSSRTLTVVLKVGKMPDMNYCGPHPSIKYEIADPKIRQVTGMVRDYSDDRPIVKAQIALLQEGERQPIRTRRSDDSGKFTLNNPPAGRYTLRVSQKGYWQQDAKELLIPREDSVFVDFPILKRNRIVVCQ